MAGTFPIIAGGSTVMYPLRVTYSCLTRVQEATNSARQRWVVRPPMANFDAAYTNLKTADQNTLQNFFINQKGAFDTSWTLAFDGKVFTGMRFMSDELRWEERIPSRFSTRLAMSGYVPAVVSPPSSLPPLPSGAVTQRPWSKRITFDTNYVDLESGPRRALAKRGGGLIGWPNGPKMTWDLSFPSCSPAFVASFVAFFLSKNGRFGSFAFGDPDTLISYPICYFAEDDLEVSYNGYNRCAFNATIVSP